MKNILWKRALFLFLLIGIMGCIRESKRYFIFLHPSDTNSERLQAAVSVINKRLLTVYEDQVTAHVKGTLVELQLREKVNVKELLWLVMSEGRFCMQEVYPNHEILQRIITIDPDVSDTRFLDFQSGSSSGSIGEAGRYDTAEIMHSRTMQTIKKENKNLQLLWGTQTKQWSIPLYALKRPTSRPILDNHSIKTAKLDFDERAEESVSVELKDNFHYAWLTMTRKNIGKPIALCLDGRVLSAPIVSSEIPNGRLSISGNLEGKARILSALISADRLPVAFSISSIDPELLKTPPRSHPTEQQIRRYETLRREYVAHRHAIDSILRHSPAQMIVPSARRELGRLYYEDLPTIVDEVGLTEEQVDEFLDKASTMLQTLKSTLDPNAEQTPQSLFDSLKSVAHEEGS